MKIALAILVLVCATAQAAVTLPYVFNAGQTIKSAEVNANFGAVRDEINNHEQTTHDLQHILAAGNSAGITPINFNHTQAQSFRVENVAVDPVCSPVTVGRLIWNTTSGLFKVCSGSTFLTVAGLLSPNLDSILANGNSAGTHNVDVNHNELLNARVENLNADPVPGHAGRLYFNTSSGFLKLDTGVGIQALGGSQGLSSVLGVSNSAGAYNVDFNNNQALNLVLEKLGVTPGAGNAGRIFYNTGTSRLQYDTGASIVTVPDVDASNPANITQDATHRFATDAEKATWSGKQDALGFTPVPNTRTVNGHALNADVTVTKGDVGLGSVPNVDATNPANITQDATHRFATDAEKTLWNSQDALKVKGVTVDDTNKADGKVLGYVGASGKIEYVDGGAGGGGGSLQWHEIDLAPIPSMAPGTLGYYFEPLMAQRLYTMIRVPSGYKVGKPIRLLIPFTCAATSNDLIFGLIGNYITPGANFISTGTAISTSKTITMSAGNALVVNTATIDITDASGMIGATQVQPGGYIRIYLSRLTDTATQKATVFPYSSEVTFQ